MLKRSLIYADLMWVITPKKILYFLFKHFVNGGPSTEFPHPHQATRTGSTVGQRCRPSPKKRYLKLVLGAHIHEHTQVQVTLDH